MCGIGGILSTRAFVESDIKAFDVMLTSLLSRGRDAWGFFDGRDIFKKPGSYNPDSDKKELYRLVGRARVFLCHTRKATKGSPENNENNHPLRINSLVMAHNGIVTHSDRYPKPHTIEVDSYDILYWIWVEYQNTGDTVRAIERGLAHIEGDYAIWLYNIEEGRTYLVRNENRPLVAAVIEAEDRKLIFASEERTLHEVAEAYGVELGEEHIVEIQPHVVYLAEPEKGLLSLATVGYRRISW